MTVDITAMGFGSVDEYQRFHRLPETGVVDRPTQRSLSAPRFCGLPDRMDLGGQVCYWQKRDLRCSWIGGLPNISDEDVVKVLAQAWSFWMAVCGIRVETTLNDRSADILVTSKRMDGPAGVVGQAQLPCGPDRQRPMEFDEDEPWVTIIDPPRYRMSLLLTAIHEGGHILGLVHGPPGSIMQATYSAAIKKLQPWEIAEAQERYGAAPITPIEPPPIIPGEPTDFINVRIPRAWVG